MRVTSSKSAVLILIAAASALIAGCPPDGSPDGAGRESPGPQNTIDNTNGGASYVGSNACRNCHTELANIQALHGHNWILNPTQGQPPEFPDLVRVLRSKEQLHHSYSANAAFWISKILAMPCSPSCSMESS